MKFIGADSLQIQHRDSNIVANQFSGFPFMQEDVEVLVSSCVAAFLQRGRRFPRNLQSEGNYSRLSAYTSERDIGKKKILKFIATDRLRIRPGRGFSINLFAV